MLKRVIKRTHRTDLMHHATVSEHHRRTAISMQIAVNFLCNGTPVENTAPQRKTRYLGSLPAPQEYYPARRTPDTPNQHRAVETEREALGPHVLDLAPGRVFDI